MAKIEGETPLEYMHSAVFGVEVTEEQLLEQAKRPKLKARDILFGPIAKAWHKKHPILEESNDDFLLLGS